MSKTSCNNNKNNLCSTRSFTLLSLASVTSDSLIWNKRILCTIDTLYLCWDHTICWQSQMFRFTRLHWEYHFNFCAEFGATFFNRRRQVAFKEQWYHPFSLIRVRVCILVKGGGVMCSRIKASSILLIIIGVLVT